MFNKKTTYLTKLYQNNNPLYDHLTINQRLFNKTMTFLLTSIIYFILKATDRHDLFNRSNALKTATNGFFQIDLAKILPVIIMISLVISSLGLFTALMAALKPKFLQKPFFKANFQSKMKLYNILDIISLVPICAVIAMFINIYIFSMNVVRGSSMEPTFIDGDKVVILHLKPKRFDVVIVDVDPKIYDVHHTTRELYIKRLIGLPGDTVEYKADDPGYVYINGERYPEDFLPTPDNPQDFEDYCLASNYSKFCLYVKDGVVFIPEGHYLVIGDNRQNSLDSRRMGFIREKDIVGIVVTKSR